MKKVFAILGALLILVLGSACSIEIRSSINTPDTATPATPIAPTTPSMQPAVTQVTPADPSWKAPTPTDNSPALPNIADVVEAAYTEVVTITTEQYVSDIFSRQVTQTGAGSGWVLDKKGIIVTNNHVVEGAAKIMIQFADGRTYQGNSSNVSRDPLTDLAIIKINMDNLPVAAIGDSSKLRVGEWVVAIGNPLGKGIRAKEGTISGIKVSLSMDEEESLYDLIETSAAINPGNSGGPLVNMKGEVVGITSAKIAEVGVEGMGYAISINSAMPILQELITRGYITRPFLGVELYTVNKSIAYYYGLGVDRGAAVTFVQASSPAAKAGLRRLDVITKYQDKDINTAPELLRALRNSQIGDEITVTYVRGKTSMTATMQLTKSPPPK